MKTTIEERKIKAIELLNELNIYNPYIEGYQENNYVCFYENFAGFWVYQEPEIEQKMKALEEKYNATCYAITHEYTEFGECWDFLIVPEDSEDWEYLVNKYDEGYSVLAYVWNKDDDWSSEFGDIGVQSYFGGLKRTA